MAILEADLAFAVQQVVRHNGITQLICSPDCELVASRSGLVSLLNLDGSVHVSVKEFLSRLIFVSAYLSFTLHKLIPLG